MPGVALSWPSAIPPVPHVAGTPGAGRPSALPTGRAYERQEAGAWDALSAAEKAAVLDELLTARPDLREPAEAYAAQLMKDAGRSAVADDVESVLKWLDINELNTLGPAPSAGLRLRRSGRGHRRDPR